MALLWCEGWEWLSGTATRDQINPIMTTWYPVWDIGTGTGQPLVATRTGYQGLQLDTGHDFQTRKLRDPDDTNKTLIFGFYLTTPGAFGNNLEILRVLCGQAVQCSFEINTAGTLDFQRGVSVVLDTSTYAFSVSNDYYVEFKIVIGDGTDGSMEMRVADITASGDNTETAVEWTVTDVDTRGSTQSDETSWDAIHYFPWRIGTGTVYEDLYICDGSGTENNDFLGNIIVESISPDGAGNSSQWTPSTGSNWQNVDEDGPNDGDTTYNTADADGETDLYTMTDIVAPGPVLGVQVQAEVRVTSGNPRKVRLPIRSGTTTSEGDDLTVAGDDYGGRHRIIETNPDTGNNWTNGQITDVEVGIKRQS